MDLHPALEIAFVGIAGAIGAAAIVWFYAGLGLWMDDAFDKGRWGWFAFLLLFTFPASLIAWLVMRALRNRTSGAALER